MPKKNKTIDVQKFGGVDDVGSTLAPSQLDGKTDNFSHDLKSLEVQSQTHLEDDHGEGGAAIIRMFEFGINPQAFKEAQPTKQQLFNSHYKGIELALWRDGMKVMTEVNPRVLINDKTMTYQIFVGAQPMRGHILRETPRTLSEQLNG